MKICLNCLTKQDSKYSHTCIKCNNKDILNIASNKYYYKGKWYTKSKWYQKINSFLIFNENNIILREKDNYINLVYIRDMFIENIRKYTFLGFILPCVVFFLGSLISLCVGIIMQISPNFNHYYYSKNVSIYSFFVFGFLMLISILLFIKFKIRKEKIFLSYIKGQTRYTHITNEKHQFMLRIFNKFIDRNNQNMYFKDLFNNDIIIREFNKGDASDFFELMKNPNVCKYLVALPLTTMDEAKGMIDKIIDEYKNGYINKLAIVEKNSNKVIGYIGLSKFGLTDKNCEIVYALNELYWGKGIMVKAVKLFVKYLIEQENKNLIIGTHIAENINSGKVLLKSGFIRNKIYDRDMIIREKVKRLTAYSFQGGINEKNI